MLPWRRIKLLLLATLILLGAVSIGLFLRGRQMIGGPKPALSGLPTQVDMHLSGVNYTEMKRGRKEWTLKADSLRYSRASQLLHFEQVALALFSASDRRVEVTGQEANYDRQAKLVRLSGHVLVEDLAGYRLTANELMYHVDTKKIFIPGAFSISGPKLTLRGQDLTVDIDARWLEVGRQARMRFEGRPGGRGSA
jgi:LPS export ABC transporter protein LptC